MQRSFSIVDDEDNESEDKSPTKTKIFDELNDSDSEELSIHKSYPQNVETSPQKPARKLSSRIPSAGPSGRKTVIKSFKNQLSSDSESETSLAEKKIPNAYDAKQFESLDVNDDIKEIFQYIGKYTPQELNLDTKFKPFVPEFLPAVGDIDAFLKVLPPEITISGGVYDDGYLGLIVLDEPATNQSDPALLHLQLKATSVNSTASNNVEMVVKKVDNTEKNAKVIDKWIKDISDLHKSKSSPTVRYLEPMPDLDDLMQEWPEDMEKKIKETGFPKPDPDSSLSDYVENVCGIFQIPCNKNKQHSLHLLFSLYAAVKNSQLYRAANNEEQVSEAAGSNQPNKNEADQLVLD